MCNADKDRHIPNKLEIYKSYEYEFIVYFVTYFKFLASTLHFDKNPLGDPKTDVVFFIQQKY